MTENHLTPLAAASVRMRQTSGPTMTEKHPTSLAAARAPADVRDGLKTRESGCRTPPAVAPGRPAHRPGARRHPASSAAAALGALWLLLLAAAPAGAQGAFFDEGNRLYQAGDFEGALDRYRRILDEGLESGELYYNIGNAHFRLGELAPAILNYERARRLMPGDDDLLANLALARSMTADDITPRPEFWLFRAAGWWVGLLPRAALIWLVALGWVTAIASAAVVVLRPRLGLAAWARRAALAAAAVALVLGVNLVVRELGLGADEEAIVMAEEAQVQSAPSDDPALQIFAVHAGTKVAVDRRSDEWVEIVLEDGAVGWMRAAQLELVGE